ncbi:unnamed protein product, partial [Ectocarpus sp. 8 AP-2014]
QAEELSQAVVTGLKEGLIDFDHLQETVDRSLGYQHAAKEDVGGALERFSRCVEVFERY